MPLTTDEQQTPVTPAPPAVEQRPPFLQRPGVRKAIAALIASASVITVALLVVYLKVGRVIDKELASGPFADTMDIFSSSKRIAEGDAITAGQLIAELQHRGYRSAPNQNAGFYSVNARGVSITPGPQAHSAFEPCLVEFSGVKIARIVAQSGRNLREIALEPTLITNVSDKRERRRIVTFK